MFDEDNVVSHAGLVPLLELAEQTGLSRLLDEHVRFTSERVRSGAANSTPKLTAIVAGMAAGADNIDDLDVIRAGGMNKLFGGVYANATLGILLREFTHGHSRQLSAVLRRHLIALAEQTPVLAGIDERCYIDIDSLLRPVYGRAKQGASFGHTKIAGRDILRRGLSPLAVTICTRTAAPVVAGVRLRAGRAGSSRGAASMSSPNGGHADAGIAGGVAQARRLGGWAGDQAALYCCWWFCQLRQCRHQSMIYLGGVPRWKCPRLARCGARLVGWLSGSRLVRHPRLASTESTPRTIRREWIATEIHVLVRSCVRQTGEVSNQGRGPRAKVDQDQELRADLRAAFRWRRDRTDVFDLADPTGWWADPRILRRLGPALAAMFTDPLPTVVLGPQSSGSLLGALVAVYMRIGLVEVRKEPRPSTDSDRWLIAHTPPDYRDRTLALGLRREHLRAGDRALLVDDWIQTGGQAVATHALVRAAGARWCGAAVIVDGLQDSRLRRDLQIRSLLHVRDL